MTSPTDAKPFVFSGKLPDNTEFHFDKEGDIKNDGNCGFQCLDVTREAVATTLARANTPENREFLEEEINDYFHTLFSQTKSYYQNRSASFPATTPKNLKSAIQQKWFSLIEALQAADDEAAAATQARRNAAADNKQEEADVLAVTAAQLQEKAQEAILHFCRSEEAFNLFCDALKDQRQLGVRSAVLYARLKQDFNLYIWQPSTNPLPEDHFYTSPTATKTIHMFHTENSSHFNLLIPAEPTAQKVVVVEEAKKLPSEKLIIDWTKGLHSKRSKPEEKLVTDDKQETKEEKKEEEFKKVIYTPEPSPRQRADSRELALEKEAKIVKAIANELIQVLNDYKKLQTKPTNVDQWLNEKFPGEFKIDPDTETKINQAAKNTYKILLKATIENSKNITGLPFGTEKHVRLVTVMDAIQQSNDPEGNKLYQAWQTWLASLPPAKEAAPPPTPKKQTEVRPVPAPPPNTPFKPRTFSDAKIANKALARKARNILMARVEKEFQDLNRQITPFRKEMTPFDRSYDLLRGFLADKENYENIYDNSLKLQVAIVESFKNLWVRFEKIRSDPSTSYDIQSQQLNKIIFDIDGLKNDLTQLSNYMSDLRSALSKAERTRETEFTARKEKINQTQEKFDQLLQDIRSQKERAELIKSFLNATNPDLPDLKDAKEIETKVEECLSDLKNKEEALLSDEHYHSLFNQVTQADLKNITLELITSDKFILDDLQNGNNYYTLKSREKALLLSKNKLADIEKSLPLLSQKIIQQQQLFKEKMYEVQVLNNQLQTEFTKQQERVRVLDEINQNDPLLLGHEREKIKAELANYQQGIKTWKEPYLAHRADLENSKVTDIPSNLKKLDNLLQLIQLALGNLNGQANSSLTHIETYVANVQREKQLQAREREKKTTELKSIEALIEQRITNQGHEAERIKAALSNLEQNTGTELNNALTQWETSFKQIREHFATARANINLDTDEKDTAIKLQADLDALKKLQQLTTQCQQELTTSKHGIIQIATALKKAEATRDAQLHERNNLIITVKQNLATCDNMYKAHFDAIINLRLLLQEEPLIQYPQEIIDKFNNPFLLNISNEIKECQTQHKEFSKNPPDLNNLNRDIKGLNDIQASINGMEAFLENEQPKLKIIENLIHQKRREEKERQKLLEMRKTLKENIEAKLNNFKTTLDDQKFRNHQTQQNLNQLTAVLAPNTKGGQHANVLSDQLRAETGLHGLLMTRGNTLTSELTALTATHDDKEDSPATIQVHIQQLKKLQANLNTSHADAQKHIKNIAKIDAERKLLVYAPDQKEMDATNTRINLAYKALCEAYRRAIEPGDDYDGKAADFTLVDPIACDKLFHLVDSAHKMSAQIQKNFVDILTDQALKDIMQGQAIKFSTLANQIAETIQSIYTKIEAPNEEPQTHIRTAYKYEKLEEKTLESWLEEKPTFAPVVLAGLHSVPMPLHNEEVVYVHNKNHNVHESESYQRYFTHENKRTFEIAVTRLGDRISQPHLLTDIILESGLKKDGNEIKKYDDAKAEPKVLGDDFKTFYTELHNKIPPNFNSHDVRHLLDALPEYSIEVPASTGAAPETVPLSSAKACQHITTRLAQKTKNHARTHETDYLMEAKNLLDELIAAAQALGKNKVNFYEINDKNMLKAIDHLCLAERKTLHKIKIEVHIPQKIRDKYKTKSHTDVDYYDYAKAKNSFPTSLPDKYRLDASKDRIAIAKQRCEAAIPKPSLTEQFRDWRSGRSRFR